MSTPEEALRFTFPEAHQYWVITAYRDAFTLALAAFLLISTMPGSNTPANDTSQLLMTGTVLGTSVVVSLAYWSRINKLTPRLNQRFTIELMLRTGHPTVNDTADVTRGKHTITTLDQDGNPHYWTVQRKRGTFTVTPA